MTTGWRGTALVGLDPVQARELERLLERVAADLERSATRIQRLLEEAGVACSAPVQLREIASGCASTAADLHRRIEAVREGRETERWGWRMPLPPVDRPIRPLVCSPLASASSVVWCGQPGAPEAVRHAEGGPQISSPKDFDPKELEGLTPEEVRRRIPPDWVGRPTKSGGGEVFADPDNVGRQIRIMPGYPPESRPDPLTHGPYVVVAQNGRTTKLPLAGNGTL